LSNTNVSNYQDWFMFVDSAINHYSVYCVPAGNIVHFEY